MRATSLYGVIEKGSKRSGTWGLLPGDMPWRHVAETGSLLVPQPLIRCHDSLSMWAPAHIGLLARDTEPEHLTPSRWHGLHELKRKCIALYGLQLLHTSPARSGWARIIHPIGQMWKMMFRERKGVPQVTRELWQSWDEDLWSWLQVSQWAPFIADCHHLWASDRSILSRGTSRNKGLESGPGMAK